ncbi:MAG: hypothetical protein WC976_05865 [Caldisericia bacterium]
MNWIWDFDKDTWQQVQEYLVFMTAEMEPAKQSWIRSQYLELSPLCSSESPPEHIMLIQMLCSLHRHIKNDLVKIKPQAEIRTDTFCGRVDFFLETVVGNIAVECDGKRHLEPAVHARDAKNSREILNAGYAPFRFGSSEIFANAANGMSGEEVRVFIDNRIQRLKERIRIEDFKFLIRALIEDVLGPELSEFIKKQKALF